MSCINLGENDENIPYNCFFEDVTEQVKAAKLKIRERLIEEET